MHQLVYYSVPPPLWWLIHSSETLHQSQLFSYVALHALFHEAYAAVINYANSSFSFDSLWIIVLLYRNHAHLAKIYGTVSFLISNASHSPHSCHRRLCDLHTPMLVFEMDSLPGDGPAVSKARPSVIRLPKAAVMDCACHCFECRYCSQL